MTAEEYIQAIRRAQWIMEKGGPRFAPENALPICEEALNLFPQEARLYYMKACVLWNQSQTAAGKEFSDLLKKAAEMDPEWAKSALKTYTYQVGGKELIWMDYSDIYSNLYIKDFWNIKDEFRNSDQCCVEVRIESNDTFCFWTFNGEKIRMQIKDDKITCLDVQFTK